MGPPYMLHALHSLACLACMLYAQLITPVHLSIHVPCLACLLPADFLVTHPTRPVEGVVGRLRDHLVARGRLLLQDEGMCWWAACGWLGL